jgi:hypothetical protein
MADIEISIRLECDDCGAALQHRGSKLVGDEAHVCVYPCENCRDVNEREHAKEVADLQSRIKSLQMEKETKQ